MFADRTNWNLTPNRLAEALARHRAGERGLLDLTASNPTECGFDYDERAILGALQQPQALHYRPDPRGLASSREAVCRYYAERGDSQVAAEQILLTTSTSEAYSFVFRLLCNPGDEVLVPEPSYPLFEFLADIQDVKLARYPLFYDHGWHIDFHALEQVVTPRTRAVIVVHPNNPTGHFLKPDEVRRLNLVCSQHDLAILADEVFLDFSLATGPHASLVTNQETLTFTLSGLSKIVGLPQMKLAWVIASGPDERKREALARLEVIADTYLSLSTPIQLAARQFFDQRRPLQEQLMGRVRKNLAELDSQLAGQKACRRLEVEGGWYAVLRVPATRPDEELAIELLEQGDVYLHPGHFFGFPSDGYLVVSLITPEAAFSEGIRRVLSRLGG
jgi:aspartate/methionine/tyrosine aminotransferase